MEKTHKCKGCQRGLPLSAYGIRLHYGKNGGHKRRSRCKECEAEYGKWRRDHHPEKVKETKRKYAESHPEMVKKWHHRRSWRKMGLDPNAVEKFITTHNGRCDICGCPPNGMALAVDHCHTTKTFRGVLCSNCNIGLGHFKNDPALLDKAKLYLIHHTASLAVSHTPDPHR